MVCRTQAPKGDLDAMSHAHLRVGAVISGRKSHGSVRCHSVDLLSQLDALVDRPPQTHLLRDKKLASIDWVRMILDGGDDL